MIFNKLVRILKQLNFFKAVIIIDQSNFLPHLILRYYYYRVILKTRAKKKTKDMLYSINFETYNILNLRI